jgi:hypothetical protein
MSQVRVTYKCVREKPAPNMLNGLLTVNHTLVKCQNEITLLPKLIGISVEGRGGKRKKDNDFNRKTSFTVRDNAKPFDVETSALDYLLDHT